MFFDIQKIKEELKPIQVITYLQIPYKRVGKNISIYCPEHEQNTGCVDRNLGNCIVGDSFQRAYHCFGCGAYGDCFKLIAYLENLDRKKDFPKILEIAAEACGGSELYLEKEIKSLSSKKEKIKENLSLTKDQLSVIGLSKDYFPQIYTDVFSGNYDLEDRFIKELDYSHKDELGFPLSVYYSWKPYSYSIESLVSEDFELYSFIVKNKAFEAMKQYKELYLKDWASLYKDSKSIQLESFIYKIKSFYKNEYIKAKSIWKLFASQDEISELNDSWIYGYDFKINKRPGAIL